MFATRVNLKSFILVGHIPLLEKLVNHLTNDKYFSSISIKAGGFVKIKLEKFAEPYNAELLLNRNPGGF